MNVTKSLLLCGLLAGASLQASAACYTVYDSANRVAYSGERAPVDMSLPIHDALQARYPGGHLVFDTTADCPSLVTALPAAVRGGSPLLTDEQTARKMGLPHTTLAGGIALVQAREGAMRPGVTVVPAAGVAVASNASRETVITEWRDPRGVALETIDRGAEGASTRVMGASAAPRR